MDRQNIESPQDYIYATLTDEDPVNDVMNIFRQYYPNTMKIDYDNAHTRAIEQTDLRGAVQERSYAELVSDFYRIMYGCEISEEELKIMKKAAKEAGVIDETD